MPTRHESADFVLRTYDLADVAAVWLAIEESRDTLWPWMPWARAENTSLATTAFTLEKFRRELGRPAFDAGTLNLVVGVFDRASGRLVGGTGAHSFRAHAHQAEIGYWVRTSERGRGVCTRAARAMVSWLFGAPGNGGWGLRRAEIVCAGGNHASAAVARKIGATLEGHTRADRWIPGFGWDDTLRFGILRDAWMSPPPDGRAPA